MWVGDDHDLQRALDILVELRHPTAVRPPIDEDFL
jgi:hypothetical protein